MKPEFDTARAAEMIGKRIMVNALVHNRDAFVVDEVQFYGEIVRVNETEGIVIRRADTGEEYCLPSELEAIQPAPPGEYVFQGSGEVVVNPDYMANWVNFKTRF
ncbi:MAG: hypothetical protein ACM3QZ_12260 [Solirubrobacterales bacterium]